MWHDHHHKHWIGIALVAALALLAFEAAGQGANAAAMFEGRPAMAGAQGGQGAQAGPAQGGLALQGSNGAQLHLRRPHVISQLQEPVQGIDERRERRFAILGIEAQPRRGM